MKIELPLDNPLAKALMESTECYESWLIVKTSDSYAGWQSPFRAAVQRWSIDKDSTTVTIDFETWEEYMERKAREVGL